MHAVRELVAADDLGQFREQGETGVERDGAFG
jgi:hypothetical protein